MKPDDKIEQEHRLMSKESRHAAILERLMLHESAQVTDLANLLNVSPVTIRKDLTELEKANKLYRSHGKAILINPYINNRNVNEKEKLNTNEKRNIGRVAAQLIERDDTIILASGTTVHALARAIKPIHKLTLITASVAVSNILSQEEDIDIIQLGGIMRHSSQSVVGRNAERYLNEVACSKLFLGIDGIDFGFGITTTDIREAELNQAMMHTAQKTIVLADSSKFGRRGFSKIANIEDIDIIITDAGFPQSAMKELEEMGIELIIAR